nr:hypothetical protein [Tanacetum cinerariifolium]
YDDPNLMSNFDPQSLDDQVNVLDAMNAYNMANENVLAPAPIIFDDQILPFVAWFDEDWFRQDANLIRETLEITPVDQAYHFVSPSSGDAIMDFMNQLGYPREIHFVSRMAAKIYSSLDALCLTKKSKKTKPHVIPYCRFTKLIIYYLGRHHNINQRSGSPLNLAEDDLSLGNLKFVPKAKKEGGKKKTASKADKPVKPVLTKQVKPATAKQPKRKTIKEKLTNPTPLQKVSKGKVKKVQNVKSSLQLVDEPDEEQAQPEPKPKLQGEGEEYDGEQAIQMSLELFQAQGQAHVGGLAIRELVAEATRPLLVVEDQFIFQRQTPATEEASTGPSAQPQDDTSANIVRETLCMSTRSNSSYLFSPLRDPESLIQRRNLGEMSSLFDFKEVMNNNHNQEPPPQNNNGPPSMVRPNGQAPRTMEELCQPSIQGRGGPIAPIPIQATDFGLRQHMIQQV